MAFMAISYRVKHLMIDREAIRTIKPIYTAYCVFKYFEFQLKLARVRFHDWKNGQRHAGMPVPPARLRHRVHGALDAESFLQIGTNLAQNIRDLCALAERDLYSFQNVLDFGCGSGRVIRNFQDAPSSCRLFGTDIDAELVGWCKEHLPGVQWSVNGYQPPLQFEDNAFDLIYAISVFTHLDEQFQHAWLAELNRIAKPGATLILSVQGDYCVGQLAPSLQTRIQSDGFLFLTGATGKLKIDKLPDFYQTAYHTREYIQREWSAYFDVVRYVQRGINNHHDAVLLRKPLSA